MYQNFLLGSSDINTDSPGRSQHQRTSSDHPTSNHLLSDTDISPAAFSDSYLIHKNPVETREKFLENFTSLVPASCVRSWRGFHRLFESSGFPGISVNGPRINDKAVDALSLPGSSDNEESHINDDSIYLEESLLPGTETPCYRELSPTLRNYNNPELNLRNTVFNLTNSVVGLGILSLPFAYRASGFCAIFICAGLTILYCYTGKLIGWTLDAAEQIAESAGIPKLARDWQWLGYITYGETGRRITTLALFGELWLVMLSYLVIAGVNINLIFPGISKTWAIFGSGLLAILLLHAKIEIIAYISLVANAATVAAIVVFVWAGLKLPEMANLSELKFFDYKGLHKTIGIINFCFVAHAIFPTMYQSMKKPKTQYGFALYVSYAIAFIAYSGTGLFGYIMFGDTLENPYTENVGKDLELRPIPGLQIIPTINNIALTVKLEGQFPLYSLPILLRLNKWLCSETSNFKVAIPLMFVGVTTSLAALLQENIADIQTITGCFFVSMTSLMFPVIFYVRLHREKIGTFGLIWFSALFVLSLLIQWGGTFLAVRSIFRTKYCAKN